MEFLRFNKETIAAIIKEQCNRPFFTVDNILSIKIVCRAVQFTPSGGEYVTSLIPNIKRNLYFGIVSQLSGAGPYMFSFYRNGLVSNSLYALVGQTVFTPLLFNRMRTLTSTTLMNITFIGLEIVTNVDFETALS